MRNTKAFCNTLISNFKTADFKNACSALLAVILLYAVMQRFGITCPIKYLTGISCAGCGMTRAYLALLRFDLAQAFAYHPLFWIPPLFLLVFFTRSHWNKRIYQTVLFTFALLFVIIYLCRMFFGDGTIVVFKPKEGFIFRFLNNLII